MPGPQKSCPGCILMQGHQLCLQLYSTGIVFRFPFLFLSTFCWFCPLVVIANQAMFGNFDSTWDANEVSYLYLSLYAHIQYRQSSLHTPYRNCPKKTCTFSSPLRLVFARFFVSKTGHFGIMSTVTKFQNPIFLLHHLDTSLTYLETTRNRPQTALKYTKSDSPQPNLACTVTYKCGTVV